MSPRGLGAALAVTATLTFAACASPARAPSPSDARPRPAAPPKTPAPTTERARCAAPAITLPEVAQRGAIDPPTVALESPEALDHFYRALADLTRGRARDHVRIAVFGDSNLTMDFPSGHLRRALQKRFGDGGHGFVALGKPWSHYRHMDVEHDVVSGWRAYAATTSPTGDGYYGLGGIAVENRWQGAVTYAATAKAGAPVGTRASRFDVFFLERPRGGDFEVRVDGTSRGLTSTRSSERAMGRTHVDTDDGAHRIEIVSRSPEVVRLFGVALERETPGVVVDTFGVGSLNTKTMTRYDRGLVTEMLRARRYDLLVYMTGANDLFTIDAVPSALHALVATQREALPQVSVLVVTPADRGRGRSFPPTLRVVAQRRDLAKAEGAAFWDLWRAMGGRDSMKRFVDAKLAFDDAIHFTDEGGAFVGERLDRALMEGFAAWIDAHGDELGCDAPTSSAPSKPPAAREAD